MEGKPVSRALHPPQIPHNMAWNGEKLRRKQMKMAVIFYYTIFSLEGWEVPQAVVDKVLRKEQGYGQHKQQMVQRITGADRRSYFEILTWYAREHKKRLLSGEDTSHMSGWEMRVRWMQGVHWHVDSSLLVLCLLTEQKQAVNPMFMGHVTKMRFSLVQGDFETRLNPLNAELNPICYLLALLGAHHLIHVRRIRVKSLNLRLLMSYIYIWSTHPWCF